MKKFIASVTIGIALWVVLNVPNRPVRTMDARNPSPVAQNAIPSGSNVTRLSDHQPTGNTFSAEEASTIPEVQVFDGAFTVRVYPSGPDTFKPPRERPIADYYYSLAEAANVGDAEAAFELGLALRRCVGFAMTEKELNEKLNAMRQTHLVESPYDARSRFVEGIHHSIALERRRYETCKGLSNDQVMGYHDWFTVAAELGNYNAQMGTFQNALDHYWLTQGLAPNVEGFDDGVGVIRIYAEAEPEALSQHIGFTFAARSRGSLQALHDLALLYAAGILQPANGHSGRVNAYANLRAATEAWYRIRNPGSYNYDEDLRRLSNGLSIYELDWAEGQAQAILRQDNCCKEW